MTSISIPIRPIASCLAAAPAIYLAVHLYGRISPTPRSQITTRTDVAASIRESATARQLVNPRDRVLSGDSRSIDLDVSAEAARIKDETLLAAFARGFFGGSIFGPERFVLGLIGPVLLDFPEIDKSSIPSHIWDSRHLDGDSLPPRHAVLFGDFQISDISLRQSDGAAEKEQRSSESTVDFIYGSNTSHFAGMHRFSILRFPDRPGTIRVSFQSAICDPSVDKDLKPTLLFAFHGIYSALLFRESVGEVHRRILLEERSP